MDKYLLEILKEVNTIIIPGLGALSITNKETGEIMFMPYLKHDDGQLVAHIVEKEGMEENDAKNLIAKYVREILAELDKGEEYTMYKFGAFFKNGDDVDFKNWNKVTSSAENIYIPPKEEIPSPKKSQSSENKTENSTSKPTEEDVKEKKENIIIPQEEVPTKKKEIPIDKKEEIESNKEKLIQLKKKADKETTKKKRGVGFWIGIVLLLLLIGGGTYFGLNYDSLKNKIPFLAQEEKTYDIEKTIDETKEELTDLEEEKYEEAIEQVEENSDAILNEEESVSENELVKIEDNNVDDTESNTEPVTTQEVQTNSTPSQITNSGQYNIIIGAFSSIENAERLVNQLRSEGYSPSIKSGIKLHKVSIQSFSTMNEANQGLKKIKENYPHAWIDKW